MHVVLASDPDKAIMEDSAIQITVNWFRPYSERYEWYGRNSDRR
jgi:hypothetical protein